MPSADLEVTRAAPPSGALPEVSRMDCTAALMSSREMDWEFRAFIVKRVSLAQRPRRRDSVEMNESYVDVRKDIICCMMCY